MRLSDILKKKFGQPKEEPRKQEQGKEVPPPAPSSPVEFSKAMNSKPENPLPGPDQGQEMRFVKAMKEVAVTKEDLGNLYNGGLELSRIVLARVKESRAIDIVPIKEWTSKLVDLCVLGNKELESHFYEQDNNFYLARHMVNAAIMSVELGLAFGYNKSRLNELGLAAFLYDIGLQNFENIIVQPRTLSKKEYQIIRDHASLGATLISQIKDIPENASIAARHHHERANG
ncbi:MAG TPA: HD domain-containing protein, partial [Candidatus Omnitrophota bacterium]|nr:HD domain-containing protein [Candidatus Omnitrophota bacterium]